MSHIVNKLINCIKNLSDHAVNRLLDIALEILDIETAVIDRCPYCSGHHIVRYGHKRGKQRFLCRNCGRTFITTTHTIMSMSHYPASVWKDVISDTIRGHAIDFTAARLGLSHQCVFNMRHKFLLALQDIAASDPTILGQVSELDETFVLECFKGKELPSNIGRPARKHGAKAQKRGISNEYICINTGVQRNGSAIAETVNRAKPDVSELQQIYSRRIEDGALLLCDGLKSYASLADIANCTVININNADKKESSFYNLNTVNNFHSFIKGRYNFYRGVATKYLNRYNALFSLSWQHGESQVAGLCAKLFHPGSHNFHHGVNDIKGMRLVAI